MTYSNAVTERRSLVDFSLRPILKAIEERLSLPDFVPNPVMVRFALDDFLLLTLCVRVTTKNHDKLLLCVGFDHLEDDAVSVVGRRADGREHF